MRYDVLKIANLLPHEEIVEEHVTRLAEDMKVWKKI